MFVLKPLLDIYFKISSHIKQQIYLTKSLFVGNSLLVANAVFHR